MTSIHISDVRAFKQCRRKWGWASPLRENLEPIMVYAPFFTGRAVHAALEYFYRDGIPFNDTVDTFLNSEEVNMEQLEALWPSEVEQLDEQIFLIRDLIDHYSIWVKQDDTRYSDSHLEFLEMETPFDLPMPLPFGGVHSELRIAGRFDGIVRHKDTGKLYVWETKTARSITSLVNTFPLDEQCTLYIYAARAIYGPEVAGMLYNIIGKSQAKRPQITSRGLHTKNKSLNTSSWMYIQTVLEDFPDWTMEDVEEYYGDFLHLLRASDNKYFRRHPVLRTQAQINVFMYNLYCTAIEMADDSTPLYPSPGWSTCSFCSFKSPCTALHMGADPTILLQEEYQVRVSATSLRQEDDDE